MYYFGGGVDMKKEPKCILCNTKKEDLSIEAFGSQMRWQCWGFDKFVIKCNKCGLMFIYPQWTQEELDKLYDGYCDQKDFPTQKQAVRITKYLPKYIKQSDTVLEIGCGKGDNVHFLGEKNYQVQGIDKDPTYCDGINLLHKDYKKMEGKWDFIYAVQVFEHIDNPEDFIKRIQDMLLPNGKFLLEFPNTEDPILTLYHVEEFKKFYYIPHHLFFWTPKTVQMLFDKLGIKVKIKLLQKYGILNHLRWFFCSIPGNFHPHIPIIDDIYKFLLEKIIRKTDTIIILGEKK
jgi:2-polyprenyl-3-methyl-5-hydroxy-6-metoxy-1,4-benzoquinol methylase